MLAFSLKVTSVTSVTVTVAVNNLFRSSTRPLQADSPTKCLKTNCMLLHVACCRLSQTVLLDIPWLLVSIWYDVTCFYLRWCSLDFYLHVHTCNATTQMADCVTIHLNTLYLCVERGLKYVRVCKSQRVRGIATSSWRFLSCHMIWESYASRQ